MPHRKKLQEMNEALILGSLRQLELTEAAEKLNAQLRTEMAERQQVEAKLHKVEGIYRDLFNSINEGFCIIEKVETHGKGALSDYRYIETNPAFDLQSGIENVVGKTIREVIPKEPEGWYRIFDTVLSKGIPQRFERKLVSRDRTLELYVFRIGDAAVYRLAILFRDITKRKQEEAAQIRVAVLSASNKKLEREIVRREGVEKVLVKSELHEKELRARTRQLAHQVLHTQETERLRISRELHDQVVQTLIGINVRLVGLKNQAGKLDTGFQKQLGVAQNLIQTSIETIHDLSRDLRPELLDILGFVSSLKGLLKSFQEETGIRASLTAFSEIEKLDDSIRTTFYRVLQESLSNIARHAKANAVEIGIRKVATQVCMTVRDNGQGFPSQPSKKDDKKAHLGLTGMQERIEMIGGTFSIQCVKGKGTTVTARVPIEG